MLPVLIGLATAAAGVIVYEKFLKPKATVIRQDPSLTASPGVPVVSTVVPTQAVLGPMVPIPQGTGASVIVTVPASPAFTAQDTSGPVASQAAPVVVTGAPQDTFLDPGSGLRTANFSDPAGTTTDTTTTDTLSNLVDTVLGN